MLVLSLGVLAGRYNRLLLLLLLLLLPKTCCSPLDPKKGCQTTTG